MALGLLAVAATRAQAIGVPTERIDTASNLCAKDSDCPSSGVCGSDGACGRPNGAACIASSQCRSVCAPDGRCGLLPAHSCSTDASCRANVCNADKACGYLMGAQCRSADTCRSGVCQNNTCVSLCAADADCQPEVSFCDTQNTTLCLSLLQNGAACTRNSMCQAGICGTDGLCGAIAAQNCTTSAACRSGACQNGICSLSCSSDANCKEGTFCDAGRNVCTQVLTGNQSCTRNAQCDGGVCADDHLCGAQAGGNCTTPHVCRSLTCNAMGICSDHCDNDTDCDFAHFCAGAPSSSVCTPLGHVGAACTQSNQCSNGLCNIRGVCGQFNGGACGQNSDCLNGACEVGDLRCGLGKGTRCIDSAACRIGYCNASGVCAPCTQNADCAQGICDTDSGACSVDPNYLGVGLEGGGCTQTRRSGLAALIGMLVLWMGLRAAKLGRPAALGAALVTLGVGLPAQAAGFALQRFVPTDPGQIMMRVERPWYAAAGHSRLDVGLALDVGHNPLVYKTLTAGAPDVSSRIVATQFNAVLQAAVSWTSWFTASAQLPVVLVETGQPAFGQAPSSPAVGTSQLNASARVFGQADTGPVSLHLAASLRFAEGANSHAHDSVFGVLPRLIVAGRPGQHIAYAANAGALIRPASVLTAAPAFVAGNRQASELQLGLALHYIDTPARWSAGPEVNFATLLSRSGGGSVNSSLELLLGAQQSITAQCSAGLAAGIGIFGLTGTPDWRIMARVSFSPFGTFDNPANAAPDADGDSIPDADDACPDTPGVPNSDSRAHGCPLDRDGDGVVDADDLCPTVAVGLHADAARPGCPASERAVHARSESRDLDGQDVEAPAKDGQAAPSAAYTPTLADADDDFAPTAAQRDAVPDARPDAPDAAAAAVAPISIAQSDMPPHQTPLASQNERDAAIVDPKEPRNGPLLPEPTLPHSVAVPQTLAPPVVLRNHRLQLKTPIAFVGGTAKLSAAGRDGVQNLAQYLLVHKEIKRLGIDVYADTDGRVKANRKIARARANAIKQLLIAQHVPAKKVRARGLASGRRATGMPRQTRIELTAY